MAQSLLPTHTRRLVGYCRWWLVQQLCCGAPRDSRKKSKQRDLHHAMFTTVMRAHAATPRFVFALCRQPVTKLIDVGQLMTSNCMYVAHASPNRLRREQKSLRNRQVKLQYESDPLDSDTTCLGRMSGILAKRPQQHDGLNTLAEQSEFRISSKFGKCREMQQLGIRFANKTKWKA